jgi:hypothetical protein
MARDKRALTLTLEQAVTLAIRAIELKRRRYNRDDTGCGNGNRYCLFYQFP